MFYRQLRKEINRIELIPDNEPVTKYIKLGNPLVEHFTSVYRYSQSQYETFLKTRSIAGIDQVTSNWLVFDFDSTDLSKALLDTRTMASRLIEKGIQAKDLRLSFSGSKGFHIEIRHNSELSPAEHQNLARQLAGDLETFDTGVYDYARAFRLLGSVNKKTGLYKIPLTYEQFTTYTMEQIKDRAKSWSNISRSDFNWEVVELPSSILELKKHVPVLVKPKPMEFNIDDLDFSKKPKGFSNCKYAILSGFYPPGNRNNSLTALIATTKGLNFPKEVSYNMGKASVRLQSEVTGQDPFAKEELWTIVESVYKPTWTGGMYSCKKEGWLQDFCHSLGKHKCNHRDREDSLFMEMEDISGTFYKFANEFEKNKIYTGIAELDKNVTLTTSMLVGLLGNPGSGKCLGINTPIRMFDGSLKKVQDVIVGDLLMGDDSTPRRVLSLARGKEELFEINQSYGDTYIVNKSHILSLKGSASFKDSRKNRFIFGKKIDISVNDYLKQPENFKKYNRGYKVGIDYAFQNTELDPYVLGYWLGNGSSSGPKFSIHKEHNEVIKYLSSFGEKLNLSAKVTKENINGITLSLTGDLGNRNNEFLNKLRNLNVLQNKHIPSLYLKNSREVRLQLLAGLLDSDGHLSENKKNFEFCSSIESFTDEVVNLIRSLGLKASKSYKLAKYKSFAKGKWYIGEADAWRVYISGEGLDQLKMKVSYKQPKQLKYTTDPLLSTLKLKSLGQGNYYGFEIDGNRRFLLGDYTVTHNTATAMNILNHTNKMGLQTIFYSMDMGVPLIALKLIQKHFSIPLDKVIEIYKTNPERVKEFQVLLEKEYGNVKFSFKAGLTTEEIRAGIYEQEERSGQKVKLVVVDYLECVAGEYADATANTAVIANRLKDIANETETCILLLLQTQKHGAQPDEPLLSMKNIKGSSVIEQACSVVISMWREGYTPEYSNLDNYISFATIKNRLNSLWKYDFHWTGLTGQVREMTDEEQDRLEKLRNMKTARKALADKDTWG